MTQLEKQNTSIEGDVKRFEEREEIMKRVRYSSVHMLLIPLD